MCWGWWIGIVEVCGKEGYGVGFGCRGVGLGCVGLLKSWYQSEDRGCLVGLSPCERGKDSLRLRVPGVFAGSVGGDGLKKEVRLILAVLGSSGAIVAPY